MKRCVCGYLPLPDATHCPRCGKRIETTACIFPRCVDGEKPSHCGNCEGRETPYAHEYDRSAATVLRERFEKQHAHNMHILGLVRDEPAWALSRILRCEALEARRHYTRRMLQALDIYWFCAEGLPKGRYPRGRYTAEDWWNRYERYRALVEESIVV